jgi:hypothetical protein
VNEFQDSVKVLFRLFCCEDTPRTLYSNLQNSSFDFQISSKQLNDDDVFMAALLQVNISSESMNEDMPEPFQQLAKCVVSMLFGRGSIWKDAKLTPSTNDGTFDYAVNLLKLPEVRLFLLVLHFQ